jgi:hypothetical protein
VFTRGLSCSGGTTSLFIGRREIRLFDVEREVMGGVGIELDLLLPVPTAASFPFPFVAKACTGVDPNDSFCPPLGDGLKDPLLTFLASLVCSFARSLSNLACSLRLRSVSARLRASSLASLCERAFASLASLANSFLFFAEKSFGEERASLVGISMTGRGGANPILSPEDDFDSSSGLRVDESIVGPVEALIV